MSKIINYNDSIKQQRQQYKINVIRSFKPYLVANLLTAKQIEEISIDATEIAVAKGRIK